MKSVLATTISNHLSNNRTYEIKAEKLVVLKDNDAVKQLTKLYSTYVSDTDMSNLVGFFRDIDAVFVKCGGKPLPPPEEDSQQQDGAADAQPTAAQPAAKPPAAAAAPANPKSAPAKSIPSATEQQDKKAFKEKMAAKAALVHCITSNLKKG